MNKTIKIPKEGIGAVSDGYHTFDELYDHRCVLFLALMKAHKEISWYSKMHDDGGVWDGWFICGIDTPSETITYHLPNDIFELAKSTGASELAKGKKWDGHTPSDVVDRLKDWISDGMHSKIKNNGNS